MMWSFVIDANLPPALATLIEGLGHPAVHVADLAAVDSDDTVVWSLAKDRGSVIVTKDSDFPAMAAIRPNGPPIVWLRMGNTRKAHLITCVMKIWPDVIQALQAGEVVIEIR
jgi:predicted nuclease of predicted toxin-antitoxin system